MRFLDPAWLFAVLGPLFLLFGLVRVLASRRVVPQALTWLIIGGVFTAVAAWLWVTRGGPPAL